MLRLLLIKLETKGKIKTQNLGPHILPQLRVI